MTYQPIQVKTHTHLLFKAQVADASQKAGRNFTHDQYLRYLMELGDKFPPPADYQAKENQS